jgi:hypothetical protein
MTCREAIREAFMGKDEILTTGDVKQRVNASYPGRWKGTSVAA